MTKLFENGEWKVALIKTRPGVEERLIVVHKLDGVEIQIIQIENDPPKLFCGNGLFVLNPDVVGGVTLQAVRRVPSVDEKSLEREQLLGMTVQAFFTRERFMKCGVTKSVATRTENCVGNDFGGDLVSEFLQQFKTAGAIRRMSLMNGGEHSKEAIISAIKSAGLPLED